MSNEAGELLKAWRQLEAYDREEDVYLDLFQRVLFNRFLEANLLLVDWLSTQEYEPFPYYVMYVPKKGGHRPKVWTTPQDGIIIQNWVNSHGSVLERHMPFESLGYRLETQDGDRIFQPWQSGYHTYRKHMEKFTFLNDHYQYIKSDLSNFYPSIDLEQLEAEVGKHIREPKALEVLHKFIWYQVKDPNTGVVHRIEAGVAQGPPYARLLANVYLMKLDKHLRENSLSFARYVDDFVALYNTIEEAEDHLSRIDGLLRDLKLSRSQDKTKGPDVVTDGALLLDEVLRMRSEAEDLIQGVNFLDSGDQKGKLAEGLFTYFTRVTSEKEKDLLAAAKWLSFVLRNQQKLDAEPNLLRRTVSAVQLALEAGLQNVKTLRSLFRSLLRLGEGNFPNPGLHRIVLKSDEHARIAFCEVCSSMSDLTDDVFNTLEKLASPAAGQPFVRAAAFMALYVHRRLPPEDILNAALNDSNSFLQARALLSLSLLPNLDVYPHLVPFIQSDDPEVVASTLFVLSSRNHTAGALLLRQVPVQAYKRVEVISLYIATALKIGRIDALQRLSDEAGIPERVISEALEALLARTEDLNELVTLLQEGDKLSSSVREIILEQARYRLESLYPPGPTRPAVVSHVLSDGARGHGWPQADPLLCGIRTPGVKYISIPTASKWLPQERITSRRLPLGVSPEDWIDSIRNTYGDHLCPFDWQVENGPSGEQVVIDYQVPDGFRLLADVLKTDNMRPLGKALHLLASLSDLVQSPLPLDAFHILINRNYEFRIFGLAGCTGPLTYSGLQTSLDDTSPRANVRFLGLLSFHLVSGTCPLTEEAELAKDRTGSNLLVTSAKLNAVPHLHTIIAKCIEPDYRERYSYPRVLKDDLESAWRFHQWKTSGLNGKLPLPIEQLEKLHATGLQIKHMLASQRLSQHGTALHSEHIVTHLLVTLAKSGWKPIRRGLLTSLHQKKPRSRVLRMYFEVSQSLLDLHAQLASDEWDFLKRVAACTAYWGLRLEVGRYLRNVAEQDDTPLLEQEVQTMAQELLVDSSRQEVFTLHLSTCRLEGNYEDLHQLERGTLALKRQDHHKYDLAIEHGLRACALYILLTGMDLELRISTSQTNALLRCNRHLKCSFTPENAEWVVQRLWNLHSTIGRILSPEAVGLRESEEYVQQSWEIARILERGLRHPRFVTHLARTKGAGEMSSYVKLYNMWVAIHYRPHHIANIDPETERPITRDTSEFVEVDLVGWGSPKISSVLFEPLVLRTFIGSTPGTPWYKTYRFIRQHGPGGVALTGVFLFTLPFVKIDQPDVGKFLMAGLSGSILSTMIDKGITALLKMRNSQSE